MYLLLWLHFYVSLQLLVLPCHELKLELMFALQKLTKTLNCYVSYISVPLFILSRPLTTQS